MICVCACVCLYTHIYKYICVYIFFNNITHGLSFVPRKSYEFNNPIRTDDSLRSSASVYCFM